MMWLNPKNVTLRPTSVNHVQCYEMNPRDQINALIHP